MQKEGAEKFYQLCAAAPRQVTKLLKEIAQRGPLSESDVSQTLTDLTPLLLASRRLPDRAVLWDDICLVLGVSLPVLTEIVESAGRKTGAPDPQTPSRPSGPRPATPRPPKGLNKIDTQFFSACVESPALFLALPKEEWLGGIQEPSVREWLSQLHSCPDALEFREALGRLVHAGGPPELTAAAAAGVFDDAPVRQSQAEFEALADRVRQRQRENEIKSLSAQVKLTSRMGDPEEQLRLLNRLADLRAQSQSPVEEGDAG